VFYNARPLSVGSENCLTCHGDPNNAPASQRTTYGTENGYGWQLGEIVSAQTIYVPAQDIFARAQRSLALVMGIIVAIFVIVIIATTGSLRYVVVRPVIQIARLAHLIGSDTLTPQAPELATVSKIALRKDELGDTAKVIRRMAQEIYQREQKLKQQIQSLRIQVDADKQTKEVKEITESEYFRNLQQRVQQIRQRSHPADKSAASTAAPSEREEKP